MSTAEPSVVPHDIRLSSDRRVLTIPSVGEQHIGCYVLRASNGVGRGQETRGYIDIQPSGLVAQDNLWTTVGPVFVLLTILLVAVLLIFASYKCLTMRISPPQDSDRLLSQDLTPSI